VLNLAGSYVSYYKRALNISSLMDVQFELYLPTDAQRYSQPCFDILEFHFAMATRKCKHIEDLFDVPRFLFSGSSNCVCPHKMQEN
jgi:hypothetical protein